MKATMIVFVLRHTSGTLLASAAKLNSALQNSRIDSATKVELKAASLAYSVAADILSDAANAMAARLGVGAENAAS